MQTNWPVLLSIAVFYLVVLITGIWASRKSSYEEKKCSNKRSEVTMVGGRNLNVVVSICTLTATWVGGGFILTSAEMVYSPKKGLVWALAPISSLFNLILGALFFVKPIRSRNYVTLMDPFQNKYGKTVAAVIFIPALIADVMWAACILGILGLTVSMMVDIPSYVSIGASAAVAIVYTLMGGLYSVAYTDVIQICFVFVSLWVCVPFVVTNPATSNITEAALTSLYQEPWMGKLEPEYLGTWIDELLLLAIGGASYQAFYQRVLSTATDAQAKITCYVGAAFCLILGIPPLIIGAAAASTNWNQTSYGSPSPFENGQSGMVLPIVLQHLVPFYVSLIGLGSITAAVMSSVDSVLLSAASLLGRNIFKNIFFTQASEKRVIIMVKLSIFVCGLLATVLAMASKSVHLLWIVSTDVMYSMMVPQVICVFFLSRHVNEYGACFSCALALLLRALIGEPLIGLPDLLPLPWDKTQENGHRQRFFPFRTAIMLIAIVAMLTVSRLALWLSDKGLLNKKLRDDEGDTNMLYMAPVSTDVEGKSPKLSYTTKKAVGEE